MKHKLLIYIPALLILFIINGCDKQGNPLPAVSKPIAKAQADTTITLPNSSITLTGSGTDASGTIVGYLWSQISGPAEASITNEASAKATIKGLVAGKYLFQFSVTDNKGLTGLDSVSVTVNPPLIISLSLSPSNNPTEFPSVAYWDPQDWSNGASVEIPLSAWTKNGAATLIRGLIKFDLSSIPSNATILSADLRLYSDTIPLNGDLVNANSGADNSVVVQQVATSWDHASVTWFNQPAGLTANQVIIPSTNLPFLNVDVDVKTLVGSMVSSNANYGFKLGLVNEVEYTSRIFCSSYYPVASRHPSLTITYEVK